MPSEKQVWRHKCGFFWLVASELDIPEVGQRVCPQCGEKMPQYRLGGTAWG